MDLNEQQDAYDDMLDDCYPEIAFGELTYSPSQVLKAVDPIAYRVGFSDWIVDLEEEDEDDD